MSRRTLRWSLSILLTVIGIAGGAVSPAAAYNCGTPGNNFDGYFTSPQSTSHTDFRGIEATIDIQRPLFCSGGSGDHFSAAWVMLSSRTDVQYVQGWAQAGFERTAGHGVRDLAQVQNGAFSTPVTYYSSWNLTTGTSRTYTAWYSPTLYETFTYVNGDLVLTGTVSQWGTPWAIQLAGETTYVQDDVPGVSNDHVRMRNAKYYSAADSAWHDLECNIFDFTNDNPSRWHRDSYSCTGKDIWTDPTN